MEPQVNFIVVELGVVGVVVVVVVEVGVGVGVDNVVVDVVIVDVVVVVFVAVVLELIGGLFLSIPTLIYLPQERCETLSFL